MVHSVFTFTEMFLFFLLCIVLQDMQGIGELPLEMGSTFQVFVLLS